MRSTRSESPSLRTAAGVFGAGALLVACCAFMPVLLGVLAGATLGGAFGVAGIVLTAMALAVLLVARRRRGRACSTRPPTA